MNQAFAQSTVQPIHADDPEHGALLALATAPAEQDLHKAVDVQVERLDRLGHWVFLLGSLRGPDGGRFDYRNTPYAEAAATGGMSDAYAALLKQDDGGQWSVVAHATGPGDVAWFTWPNEYGAPSTLFGF